MSSACICDDDSARDASRRSHCLPLRVWSRIRPVLTRYQWLAYRRSLSEIFRINVIASNDSNKTPIMTLGSTTFFHVRHANLYLACATRTNVNAALVFEFIYRVISIGRSYFGKLDEEAVKNNFVLIYELLDGACVHAEPHPHSRTTLQRASHGRR